MRIIILASIIGFFLTAFGSSAAVLSVDQEDARSVIKTLYAISPATFEFAVFDGRLNLKRHCDLLKKYFLDELVKQPTLNSGCIVSHLLSVRYPSLGLNDLTDVHVANRLPKPEISSPLVQADEMAIDVITNPGKSVYFLKKIDDDWRIVNALIFEKWPIGDGPCLSTFLVAPNREQKKFESRQCIPQKSKL